jgi:uncharacterized RDD family membrane protein YckC
MSVMEISCPECRRVIEYSREPPRFCSHCGKSLAETQAYNDATLDYQHPSGSSSTPARADVQLPRDLGDYRLLRELGRGGMGVVYESEHIPTRRHVALKVLPPQGPGALSSVERFVREGKLAASISHPRSTFVYAAGEIDGQFYIAMELMSGGTIKDVVDKEGPLPIGRAVDFILDVLDGLTAAHAIGVIHRDVKPSNCFLDGSGRAKVGDYGLSKSLAFDASLTRTGSFLGTPLFAAPEQVRGEAVDARTDVYALGATLYFLLTGHGPFEGDAAQVIAKISSDPAPSLRRVRRDAARELERIVARTLEKDPARRFPNLDQLRQALRPFATRGASIADLGRRLAALFLDLFLVGVVNAVLAAIAWVVIFGVRLSQARLVSESALNWGLTIQIAGWLLAVLYFAVGEGFWGHTVGKRLLGLSVVGRQGTAPGLPRALLRAIILPGLTQLVIVISTFAVPKAVLSSGASRDTGSLSFMLTTLSAQAIPLAGWGLALLCLVSMRRSNGYRGLHEFASGTRVVSVRRARRGDYVSIPEIMPATMLTTRKAADETIAPEEAAPPQAPEFGPFRAVGLLGKSEQAMVWQGKDRALERSAWVYVQPDERPRFAESRFQVARATRPHWLEGGTAAGARWDAFEAVRGAPLVVLLATPRGLPWEQCRVLLAELAGELRQSLADGSLPPSLTLEQVWIDRDGRLKLLDSGLVPGHPAAEQSRNPFADVEPPLSLEAGGGVEFATSAGHDPHQAEAERAAAFFRLVVARCIQGKQLSGRAHAFVEQLAVRPATEETFVWAIECLDEMGQYPSTLTWDHRLGVMAVSASTEQAAYTMAPWMLAAATTLAPGLPPEARAAIVLPLSVLVPAIVGYAFWGGPVFGFSSVQIRHRTGRSASRWRCAWRNFWAWLPAMMGWGLLALMTIQFTRDAQAKGTPDEVAAMLWMMTFSCGWGLFFLLHTFGALVAIVHPRRGLQDFLAETMLTPH